MMHLGVKNIQFMMEFTLEMTGKKRTWDCDGCFKETLIQQEIALWHIYLIYYVYSVTNIMSVYVCVFLL